jgi:hypothetical protein
VNGESDDGGRDEFRLCCPQLSPQLGNLGSALLDPFGLCATRAASST